jgi:cellulose biosynthesis protein BcsQ
LKIVFWSNVHGQAGTTSNMLAIAILCALQYKLKNIVTQTHFNLNSLAAALVTDSEQFHREYLMEVGIDALTRSIKSAPLDCDIIENSTISFMKKRLTLLPGTAKMNREIYEIDTLRAITGILRAVELYYDIVFVDTNSGKNELTNKILEDADLIVVNLSQNKNMIEEFKLNYKFPTKKVFYIFGNYDSNSRYNVKNIFKSYGFIKSKNTAVIPYNTEYMDALSDGQVLQYMLKNIDSEKDDSNGHFIKEVKEAASKLMKYAGAERRLIHGFHD